jgi:hypothetical protein
MWDFFECFKCHRVAALFTGGISKCPMCGSLEGKNVSREQFEELYKAGVYFDLDSSGKSARRKRE